MSNWYKLLSWKQKWHLFIFVVVGISMYAGLADFDWYWQVELGKSIVTRFDFNSIYDLQWGTKGVAEYLDHEWLTNVLFYLCSLCGQFGVSIAKGLICLFYAGCTCYFLDAEEKEYNDSALIGITAYLFFMATICIKVKAYILSAGFVLIEAAFLKGYKKTGSKRYFAYMGVLLILWNNMHSGSVPLFFVIAGVYWLTELKFDKKCIVALVAYLALLGVNPYGYKLIAFDIRHNFDPVMKEIVMDWTCIDAKTTLGVICSLVVLGVVFFMIGTDLKAHAFDLIMTGVVLYMSFGSARHLIYLAPFVYPIMLDNKYKLKLSDTVRFCVAFFCAGICILSVMQAFTAEGYKESYESDWIEHELLVALDETNADTCDGLFATDAPLWKYGFKSFTSGAFPCTRERRLAEVEMCWSASDARIEELIDEWGLTKFLGWKNNPALTWDEGNPGILYNYLMSSDEYECLYDGELYFYCVRKDLL